MGLITVAPKPLQFGQGCSKLPSPGPFFVKEGTSREEGGCECLGPFCSAISKVVPVSAWDFLMWLAQCRYIGSLVGDFHRTLMYGGIYG